MLYLEDYVEMIEHLPQELRDRFTEMREMDLGVQNSMDTLEKRVRVLFGNCRRNEITTDQANVEFSDIRKGFNRTLEEADEKVNLANQMYELVDRYLRRLDTEIYKIKCELEADNKGITEVLEKRSLELDMPVTANTVTQVNYHKDNRYRQRAEKRRDSWGGVGGPSAGNSTGGRPNVEGRTLVAATAPLALSRTDSAIQAALSRGLSEATTTSSPGTYVLGHMGAGSAIAVAASQAIAATQQMQLGRRTASLKASYEAINAAAAAAAGSAGLSVTTSAAVSNPNVAIGGALHTTTHHEQHNTVTHHNTGHHSSSHHTSSHHSSGHHSSSHHGSASSSANKRHKKKASSSYSNTVSGVSNLAQSLVATPSASRSSSPNLGAPSNTASIASATLSSMNVDEQLTDGEWPFDPNEPRYCICNQVSYGDMVACDNEDCPFEWFHYACVGVTAPPKGKWYCPQCNTNMRRNRGNRKN